MKPHVLISNDDGYQARGLAILAEEAERIAQVRVVAPDRNRSGVSNSLTLTRPIRIRRASNGFDCVDGTPTDCVHLAMHTSDHTPQWVLSGINHGANMGDDTLYSGTVAAATEAYLLGISAVAFSLTGTEGTYEWETARRVVRGMLASLFFRQPEKPVLWNINIPNRPFSELCGIRIARLGRRHHAQSVIADTDPRGGKIFWIGPAGQVADDAPETDFALNRQGFVTITPLRVDLTGSDMTAVENWLQSTPWSGL